MKKPDTYWTTIQLDIFRTAVLVLVAPDRKQVLEDFPLIYKEIGLKEDDFKEDIEIIRKAFHEEDSDYTSPGYTIRLANSTGDVIIMFKGNNISEISEELIVHETHHAATFVLSYRGIEDEECEAYVQEYMFNKLLCAIDDWNTKHKKKGKKK